MNDMIGAISAVWFLQSGTVYELAVSKRLWKRTSSTRSSLHGRTDDG